MVKRPREKQNNTSRIWYLVEAMTPLGRVRAAAVGDEVGCSFMIDESDSEFYDRVHRRLGWGVELEVASKTSPLTQRFESDVRRLLDGQSATLKPDLSSNTAFQKKVAMAVQKIPFGSCASYGDIATAIGKPGGAQAVGQALPKLPFALFIPTHRVVRATGSPIGCFLLTFDQKNRLLQWECDIVAGKADPIV